MISRNQQRLLIAMLLFPFTVAVAAELISVGSNGAEGNSSSEYPSISADGHFVAFQSAATNLVAGVTTTGRNIFVRNRVDNTIELISKNSNGDQGNGYSQSPSISADGHLVAFTSAATNLVAGVTTTGQNIFVRNRVDNTIELISKNSNGDQGNGYSEYPFISADGNFVAFVSEATNLVDDDNNQMRDIFVYDRTRKITERVSIADDGTEGDRHSEFLPSISANGRFVAFMSRATNLVDGDTNNERDIFVHDRNMKTTVRASIADDGTEGNGESLDPLISADGHFVFFASIATNLVAGGSSSANVFVHDLQAKTTEQVTMSFSGNQPNGSSFSPSISADGRFVAFTSSASNLVDDDDDDHMQNIFVYDRTRKITERVSIADDGSNSDGYSWNPSISGDGSVVVFESEATNLIAGGSNGSHIFLAHRLVRGGDAVSVPAMGVGVLIALISLVGGMALRMRARSRR